LLVSQVFLFILLLAVPLTTFGQFEYRRNFSLLVTAPWIGDRIESNADTQDRQRTNCFFPFITLCVLHVPPNLIILFFVSQFSVSFAKRQKPSNQAAAPRCRSLIASSGLCRCNSGTCNDNTT